MKDPFRHNEEDSDNIGDNCPDKGGCLDFVEDGSENKGEHDDAEAVEVNEDKHNDELLGLCEDCEIDHQSSNYGRKENYDCIDDEPGHPEDGIFQSNHLQTFLDLPLFLIHHHSQHGRKEVGIDKR